MPNITITDYNRPNKILAIKGLRYMTGLGLKESKHVIDDVQAGTHRTVTVGETVRVPAYGVFVEVPFERVAAEHGIDFEPSPEDGFQRLSVSVPSTKLEETKTILASLGCRFD